MSAARFRILARLDGTRAQAGTVTVERAADMFAVRPLRRRRVYALPLSVVAQMVVERVIRAEIQANLGLLTELEVETIGDEELSAVPEPATGSG